jgi:hypothetical protein
MRPTAVHVVEAAGPPVRDWMGKIWESNITCPGHGGRSINCIFTPSNGSDWSSGDGPPGMLAISKLRYRTSGLCDSQDLMLADELPYHRVILPRPCGYC